MQISQLHKFAYDMWQVLAKPTLTAGRTVAIH